MKVTSTNQTLILAGERTPGRRGADARLVRLAAASRGAALSNAVAAPDQAATTVDLEPVRDIEPIAAATPVGRYVASRTSSLNPTQQYVQIQQMTDSLPVYTRVDLYA